MNNENAVSVMNDLLHITNDRIEGFARVEGKVWEMYSELKPQYDHMITEAKIFKNELINLITERNGTPDDSASTAGAIHRAWIDIRNAIPGKNREKATLENVPFGEKTAVEAYEAALSSGDLDEECRKTIDDQLYKLRQSYETFSKISEYKD
jgi:uncharacterized protein (TIGR02284 family)